MINDNIKYFSREFVRMHRDLGAALLLLNGNNPFPISPTHTLVEGPILRTVVGRNLLERRDIRKLLWDIRKTRRFQTPSITLLWSDYNEEADLTSIGAAFLVPLRTHTRWTQLHALKELEAQLESVGPNGSANDD